MLMGQNIKKSKQWILSWTNKIGEYEKNNPDEKNTMIKETVIKTFEVHL